MKKLLAIIRKDTLVRFASRSELLFFIVLPVLFTFLLAGGTPVYTSNRERFVEARDRANLLRPC